MATDEDQSRASKCTSEGKGPCVTCTAGHVDTHVTNFMSHHVSHVTSQRVATRRVAHVTSSAARLEIIMLFFYSRYILFVAIMLINIAIMLKQFM